MQSGTKIAVASLAMLVLGSSAALAQAYGYRSYGPMIGQNGPTPGYCGPSDRLAHNWIIDPATGQAITEPEYQARYPWTNINNWAYDCNTGLWVDHTVQPNPGYYAPQARNDQYRGYDQSRNRDRERERNYARDREHQDNYRRD